MLEEWERKMVELHNAMVDANEKEVQTAFRLKISLAIGKWLADNVISILALMVAIVALIRTI